MRKQEVKLKYERFWYYIKNFFVKIILAFIPVKIWRIKTREFIFALSLESIFDPYKRPHFIRSEIIPDKEKWVNLKNKFEGKRCFVIGTAPSVKSLDLSFLNDEYTFTCNKGYELKKIGLEHSNFYCVADRSFYGEFGDSIDLNFADYYFISNKIPWKLNVNNLYVYETSGASMSDGFFQTDMTKPAACGGTVVSKMFQIAFYMGFKEIYLLGIDMDYANNAYFYNPTQNELKRTPDNYSLFVQMKTIYNATKFLDNQGVKVFNASPAGIVDCVPRVIYSELFANKDK